MEQNEPKLAEPRGDHASTLRGHERRALGERLGSKPGKADDEKPRRVRRPMGAHPTVP